MSLLTPALIRQGNKLIKTIVETSDDLRNWRKSRGVKKNWSGHSKIEEIQRLTDLKAAFDALGAFLQDNTPAHWNSQSYTFDFSKTCTAWWWQNGKKDPNQTTSSIDTQSLATLVGYVLGLNACASDTTKQDMARLKGLNINTQTPNLFSLLIKESNRKTIRGTYEGLTPADAFAQYHLAKSAPGGRVGYLNLGNKKTQYISQASQHAEKAFRQSYQWSAAPTVLPRLFLEPAIINSFGTLTYNPGIDSVGNRNPKDYDALMKLCLKLAQETQMEGSLSPYMLFTSPIHHYTVLARCEKGALLTHFFARLCQQTKGKLPTSEKHIIHIHAL